MPRKIWREYMRRPKTLPPTVVPGASTGRGRSGPFPAFRGEVKGRRADVGRPPEGRLGLVSQATRVPGPGAVDGRELEPQPAHRHPRAHGPQVRGAPFARGGGGAALGSPQ